MKKNNYVVVLLFGLSTMMASCNKQDIYESKLNGTWECHSVYALFNGEIVEELPLNEAEYDYFDHCDYYVISFFENGTMLYSEMKGTHKYSFTCSYVISNGMLCFSQTEWKIIKLTNKELVVCNEKMDDWYKPFDSGDFDFKAIDEYKGKTIYGVFSRYGNPRGYFYYNEQKDKVSVYKHESINYKLDYTYYNLAYMIFKKK